MSATVLVLPGDGIGPEVTAAARAVLETLLDLRVEEARIGGAAIDQTGVPIEASTIERARSVDAVLLGAVGGPRWANQPYDRRPEAGLLALRAAMAVFGNLRPAVLFPALADASPLKPARVTGLDLVIVRELTGGVYFGQPRGIDTADGQRRGVNTHVYTTSEIQRVARVAFDCARSRRHTVCSVDKSNVMEAGLLWREEVQALRDNDYSDVALTHMLADTCAMELVRAPAQFDVILTDNLFGDLLSDEAAMLTGSLGMLPSASLGAAGTPGLYEPIHGSAPDIAGKGIANPCGAILSAAMALRHSLGRPDLAARVENAVAKAVDACRTPDLGGTATTAAVTEAVLARI
jgi:3-isopropylmalate dehydrogenase